MSHKNIKNSVLAVISGLLCEDDSIRPVSEDRRKALEYTDEYALVLIDIINDLSESTDERLMACVLLRQYVNTYWSLIDETGSDPSISPSVREKINEYLIAGLGDQESKIRISNALALAHIAAADYPKFWPEMIRVAEQLLQSNDNDVLDGIMMFLTYCHETSVDSNLSPSIFNSLYEISGNGKYLIRVRSCALKLLACNLAWTLRVNKDPNQAKPIADVTRKFCGHMAYMLSQPYSKTSDFALKSSIIVDALCLFLKTDETSLSYPAVASTMPVVWEVLGKCAAEYIHVLANGKMLPVDEDEDVQDPMHFIELVSNIFYFAESISENMLLQKELIPYLSDILYFIIIFKAITPQLEQTFHEDEDSYCADEFNEFVPNNLRYDLKKLLCSLYKTYDEKMIIPFSIAVNKLLEGSYEIKLNDSYNWRIHESVMSTIGCLSKMFKTHPTQHDSFNLYMYLTNASIVVTQCQNVVLLARIMLTVGQFSCCMTPEQVVNHLSAISNYLRSNEHILRNAAIRALHFHCQCICKLKGTCSQHNSDTMLKGHVQALIDVFNSVLDSLMHAAECVNPMIFKAIINNICDIISINQNLTANFVNKIVPFVLPSIKRNLHDATILSACMDMLRNLGKNTICGEYIQLALVSPTLNMITDPSGVDEQSVGLHVLSVLIESSATDEVRNTLFMQGFMLAVNFVNTTTDEFIAENGIRCLCMYLLKCRSQVSMNEGNALETILGVIYRLLDAKTDRLICKHIDTLVICVMSVFNDRMLEHQEKLVKCLLCKHSFVLRSAISEAFHVIFLFYFYHYYDFITTLLSKVPAPTGESALNYVVREIVSYRYQRSAFAKNLHTLVLCQLLENTVLHDDARLKSIQVKRFDKQVPLLNYVFQRLVDKLEVQLKLRDQGAEEEEDELGFRLPQKYYQCIDLCVALDKKITQNEVQGYLLNYMRTFAGHPSFRSLADSCLESPQRQLLFEQLFNQ